MVSVWYKFKSVPYVCPMFTVENKALLAETFKIIFGDAKLYNSECPHRNVRERFDHILKSRQEISP